MQPKKYHWTVRAMHWSMSALIFALLLCGNYMANLPKDAVNKYDLYPWHKSFGVLVLILVSCRLILHYAYQRPSLPVTISKVERILARNAHGVMYVLMFAIPLSGYIMSVSNGVAFFSYPLPVLFMPSKEIAYLAWQFHGIAVYVLLTIVTIHVLAALKHRFWNKAENDILHLML